MGIRQRVGRWVVGTVAVTAVTVAALATAGSAGAKVFVASPSGPLISTGAGRRTPLVRVHPLMVRAQWAAHPAGEVLFDCQGAAGNPSGVHCYGPDQIRAAYRIQPLLERGINGRRQTIIIVGAYAPPNVAADLHTFDATWGLPDPDLQILAPQGVPTYDSTDVNQVFWAVEIALDTQWAHAVAPAAKIVLVEARSTFDPDVLAATRYAVDHNLGDVMSMSYGEPELCVDPAIQAAQHAVFVRAVRKGMTLVAGAGDTGAAQTTCDGTGYSQAASSPASDPTVLAVGGTSLTADLATGKYGSERVWNESGFAGGGGYSALYGKPGYQKGIVAGSRRGLPDVSYNAQVDGGVLTYLSGAVPGLAGFFTFGGTSAGAPQWAALTALSAQVAGHRIGEPNSALYALARQKKLPVPLHDITAGDNSFAGPLADGSTTLVPGYQATKGWDAASGLGTPIAVGVVPFLGLGRH